MACAVWLHSPAATAQEARRLIFSDAAMGTTLQVTFWTDDERGAARAALEVFAEFRRIEGLMTSWDERNALAQLRKFAGRRAVTLDAETFAVIATGQQVAHASAGLFDMSVGAFAGLWKFDHDLDGSVPTPASVARRQALVGYRDIHLSPKRRAVKLKRPGMAINLGGIAKGYAVDQAVKRLHQLGFVDFIVQAGGDLFASGRKGASPWVIGIRDPRGTRDDSFAYAPVADRAFSTSGDYERFFIHEGRRYHHILDPRTGYPAMGTRSVTVYAPSALRADAWSKALFIMGWQQALRTVEATADLDVVIVDDAGQVHISSRLKPAVTMVHAPLEPTRP